MSNCVEVINASKCYGSKNDKQYILDNFNMKVPHGAIYCLLGASGCGKTTLISCILGVKKLDSGVIKVLQEKVSNKHLLSSINSIGYMPQETALPTELTIKETIHFFASISSMDMTKFNQRYEMLSKMLEFESDDLLVESLSGGEKRRVSLAVAMIHDPILLILDEPTVGLDVLIVKKIWGFLRRSIKLNKNLSVLMSTHYPHESEKSDICGFMRNGKLIIENSPKYIMESLNAQNIDEASYILCYKRKDFELTISTITEESNDCKEEEVKDEETIFKTRRRVFESQTLLALALKKIIWTNHSRSIILITLLPPFFVFFLLIITVGRQLQGLKIGIINEENVDCGLFLSQNMTYDCKTSGLSCFFIDFISENKIQKVDYTSFEKASNDSEKGKIVGFLEIPSNFSVEFLSIQNMIDILELENSHIDIYLDRTDLQKYSSASNVLTRAYENFIEEFMPKCDRKPEVYRSGMIFRSYNNDDAKINFNINRGTMPPIYLLIVLASGINIMVFSLTQYKSEDVWNRILLSGVNIHQLLIIEIILSLLIVLAHIAQTLLLKVIFMDFIPISSYTSLILFVSCSSLFGSMQGLLLASTIDSYSVISSIILASLMMCSIGGGSVFPFEKMDLRLKMILQYTPTGGSTVPFNNVIFKGHGITHPAIYSSILLQVVWIIGLFIISYVYLLKKKYLKV